jgi:serine phosphatase RsbU (regulator of sigma subunit)
MPAPAPPSSRYSLRVIDPQGNAETLRIDALPFRIGRGPDNDLVLRDGRISRAHCQLDPGPTGLQIRDLESRHGLAVNGLAVKQGDLRPGDRIDFGLPDSYSMVLIEERPAFLAGTVPGFLSGGCGPEESGTVVKVRALREVSRAMHGAVQTEEVLGAIVDAALEVAVLDRGALLKREGNGRLMPVVTRARPGYSADFELPWPELERSLDLRPGLLQLDLDATSIHRAQPRGRLALPLLQMGPGQSSDTMILEANQITCGLLYLESPEREPDLTGGARDLLQTLALEAASVLENARLQQEARLKERIEEELRLARVCQANLLPKRLPSQGWLRAAGGSLPSRQVSGDFFDLMPVAERWVAAVADVSGKGLPSALLASLLQGAVAAFASAHLDCLDAAASSLNSFLFGRTRGERYATLWWSVLDASGRVDYVNAGHTPGTILRARGGVEPLAATSQPIGMLPHARFTCASAQLAPGDLLVLFSDGLTEARDGRGCFFDETVWNSLLDSCTGLPAPAAYNRILKDWAAFQDDQVLEDDATLLVLEFTGSG